MFEKAIETEHDIRNIGLIEISNLLEKGDTCVSAGILFLGSAKYDYDSVIYIMDFLDSKVNMRAIHPHKNLSFCLSEITKYNYLKIPEGSKLLVVPLDKPALGELEAHFSSANVKANGFEVEYRKEPLIDCVSKSCVHAKDCFFVGRYAFDHLENAKRAKELDAMRTYFITVFSGPKYG